MDVVGAGAQGLQSDAQHTSVAAVELSLALVDAGSAGILHLGGAERRLEVLRTPPAYSPRNCSLLFFSDLQTIVWLES